MNNEPAENVINIANIGLICVTVSSPTIALWTDPVVCTGIFAHPGRGDKALERIRSESASPDFSSDNEAQRRPDVQGLSKLVISIYSMLDFPGVHSARGTIIL